MRTIIEWLSDRTPTQARLGCLAFLLLFWGAVFAAHASPQIRVFVFDTAAIVSATGDRICIIVEGPERVATCAPLANYRPDAYLSLAKNENPI